MAIDLRQVAALAGVSVSTASRALRGEERVSKRTAARVQAAAVQLGYRPNASARALRTARSEFIGLVVTNLLNASFHTIAEVVQRDLSGRGYRLLLSITGGDPEQEHAALSTLVANSAAGVIVVGSDDGATGELHTYGTPTVHLARAPARPAGDCVLGNDIEGGRLATEHLLRLGHRRIAIITGPQDVQSARERLQGYWLAMRAASVTVPDVLIQSGPLSPDWGALAAGLLVSQPENIRPTALIIASHEASYGALPRLREQPVTIPDELSVVCYEDSPLARWWYPAITVVDNNARQMGELAAQRLLLRLDHATRGEPSGDFSEFRVGVRLIERDSCRPGGELASDGLAISRI